MAAIAGSGEFQLLVTIEGTIDPLSGAPTTVLDGSLVNVSDLAMSSVSMITINSGEGPDTILRGLTFINGIGGTPFGNRDVAGAAIYTEATAPTIEQCVFTNNSADYGGAVFCRDGAPTVRFCTFTDNTATFDGGAMMSSRADATIEDSTFSANQAGQFSGAINVVNAEVTMRRLLVDDNVGSVSVGGMVLYSGLVEDCIITNNTAGTGSTGGIYVSASPSPPTLIGTTICANDPQQITGSPWVDGGGNTICDCPADLDGDGEVGGSDLAQLLANWGCSDEDCVADLDGNGTVNGADLAVILSAWGDCQD